MQHQKDVSSKKELIIKMDFMNRLISLVIVGGFLFFIGSKIYDHEKEHLDPLIKKIKGWFIHSEEDQYLNPEDDYELGFRGQMQ